MSNLKMKQKADGFTEKNFHRIKHRITIWSDCTWSDISVCYFLIGSSDQIELDIFLTSVDQLSRLECAYIFQNEYPVEIK